jgi:hypothetical protein
MSHQWGMSWRQKTMTGVEDCEKSGVVVKQTLIPVAADRPNVEVVGGAAGVATMCPALEPGPPRALESSGQSPSVTGDRAPRIEKAPTHSPQAGDSLGTKGPTSHGVVRGRKAPWVQRSVIPFAGGCVRRPYKAGAARAVHAGRARQAVSPSERPDDDGYSSRRRHELAT